MHYSLQVVVQEITEAQQSILDGYEKVKSPPTERKVRELLRVNSSELTLESAVLKAIRHLKQEFSDDKP